jgi:hypothetical protein
MVRMDLHMDHMHYFLVANGCYDRAKSHDTLIGMKTHILASIP